MVQKGKSPKAWKLFLVLVVVVALVVSGVVMAQATVDKEQPVLVVTGTDVVGDNDTSQLVGYEKAYTRAELEAMEQTRQLFSAINSYNNKSLFLGVGVSISEILAPSNIIWDDYTDSLKVVASDGVNISFDNSDRYYYPHFAEEPPNDSDSEIATPIIALERGGQKGNTTIPTTTTPLDGLDLMVGQTAIDDQNNPLYMSDVVKLVAGRSLDPVLTIGTGNNDDEYTRADILMMERVKGIASYESQTGIKESAYVGVQLADLLTDYDDADQVSFTSIDNWDNSDSNTTVGNIRDHAEDYILAYEAASSANGVLEAVCDGNKKNDPTDFAYFRVYDGKSVLKGITSIEITVAGPIDFSTSEYKHINHNELNNPYNIPAITGSTLTIQGPGVEETTTPSVRALEELTGNAPYYRGNYTDTREGQATTLRYEGLRLKYILDTQVKLVGTENSAERSNLLVTLKDRHRNTLATFTYGEISAADAGDNGQQPIIIAYGTATVDEQKIMPFAFDDMDGTSWVDDELGNADGCFKLVYDLDDEDTHTKFTNIAYIYVSQPTTPGYKHDKEPYNGVENTQFIFTLTGSALGREVNYTVAELEAMAALTTTKEYSLTNTSYWYVNEYQGVRLYDLLLASGLPSDYATTHPDTVVLPHAWDNYTGLKTFTLERISDDDNFGYYIKSEAEAQAVGYPVLIAFGVNEYPYVQTTQSEGYNKGLENSGGPLRLIFGKEYQAEPNGSQQAQKLDSVIIGDVVNWSTHTENTGANGAYQALADNVLTVEINVAGGTETKTYKVSDLENLIYGSSVTTSAKAKAQVKDFYNAGGYSDLYEGVNLWYFLTDVVGLSGDSGSVAFYSGGNIGGTATLDALQATGINPDTGKDGLASLIAFGKNGYPLVENKDNNGYLNEDTLSSKTIKNQGGPLQIIVPQSTTSANDGISVRSVNKIVIDLEADAYAHLEAPYDEYATQTLTIEGDGVRAAKTYTVAELEAKSSYKTTAIYNLRDNDTDNQYRFRGVALYDLLKDDVGLKSNANGIKVTYDDGSVKEFSWKDLTKNNYRNSVSGASDLKMLLAYGCNNDVTVSSADGKPLVVSSNSNGYVASYDNTAGPLRLVVGQNSNTDNNFDNCLANVTKIEVTASANISWKHDYDPYANNRDIPVLRITGSQIATPVTFTLGDLEDMDDIIETGVFNVVSDHQFQGLNLWNLLQKIGLAEGVATPSDITIYCKDGSYSVNGITNEIINGVGDDKKPVLLAYGANGLPLVENISSIGYDAQAFNDGGLIRLIYDSSQGKCIKNTACIVVGTGAYEDPEDYPVTDIENVFVVRDQDGNTVKSYSLYDLKKLGWERTSYNYSPKDLPMVTENVVGVPMEDVLYDAGLSQSDSAATVTFVASDNFCPDHYQNITINDIIDQEYLVAYSVEGNLINDETKNGGIFDQVRIYRNCDDGIGWVNCMKNVPFANVDGLTPRQEVFTINVNGSKVKSYTMEELKDFTPVTHTYTVLGEDEVAQGVDLTTLLADSGVTATAGTVRVSFVDNYEWDPLELSELDSKEVMIAYKANGQDITDISDNKTCNIRLYGQFGGTSNKANRKTMPNGVNVTPSVAEDVFTVKVNGQATKSYTMDDLKAMEATTNQYSYKNETVSATGVLLSTVLTDAGMSNAGATITVLFTDDYTTTLTMDDVTAKRVLVTYEIDEEPITGNETPIDIFGDFTTDPASGKNCNKNVVGIDATISTTYRFNMWPADISDPQFNNVRCITSDLNDGWWIGTLNGGAYHVDGDGNWSMYNTTTTPALKNNTVVDICPDAQGGVWFAQGSQTQMLGAAYLDAAGNITYYNTETTAGALTTDFVQQVKVDALGRIWFAHGGGVARLDTNSNTWTTWDKADGLPAASVNTLILDKKGGAWIGCYPDTIDADSNAYRGGYAYIAADDSVKAYQDLNPAHQQFANQWVRSISIAADGSVYVVRSGIYAGDASLNSQGGFIDYISPSGQKTIYTAHQLIPDMVPPVGQATKEIRAVKVDAAGGLWFATTGQGLYYKKALQADEVTNFSSTLVNNEADWPNTAWDNVWALAATNNGNIYVGSVGGVAYKNFNFSAGTGNGELDRPGVPAPKTPPVLNTTVKYLGEDAVITFVNNNAWSAAITDIKVDNETLDETDYVINAGSIVIDSSAFNVTGTYTITMLATGYNKATVTQTIKSIYDTPPTLRTTTKYLGQDAVINFTNDGNWTSQIAAIKVGSTILATNKYDIYNSSIVIDASVFRTAGSYTITVEADGYDDATVRQQISGEDELNPPKLKAETSGNYVDSDITLTFTDDADWREAVTAVSVDGKDVKSSKYKLSKGKLTIDGSLFSKTGTYEIIVEADGYDDVTVKQKIVTSKHTVTFYSNGRVLYTQSVEDGDKPSKPTDPTRSGYTFDGWYKDSQCTKSFSFNTEITEDTSIYAKWIEDQSPVITTQTTIQLYLNSTTYNVNGVAKMMDVAPFLYKYAGTNYTMVPIRFVGEALGATVNWNGQVISIVKGGNVLTLTLNQANPSIGLNCPAIAQNNRTFVPLRYVAENLNCTVNYTSVDAPITIQTK